MITPSQKLWGSLSAVCFLLIAVLAYAVFDSRRNYPTHAPAIGVPQEQVLETVTVK